MKIQALIICFAMFLIHGCQSMQSQTSQLPNSIYLDDAFENAVDVETEEDIFYVSPEMTRYINSRLKHLESPQEITTRLIKDLFDPNMMNIGYAHDANFSAADTFDKGIANCMSLTLLSYVLIKETGLKTSFMDIKMEENWSFQNGRTMLNGHVNLKVAEKSAPTSVILFAKTYTIDFLPMIGVPVLSQTELSKKEILAFYYNNKGGEALALGNVDEAYQYFKAGTQLAPTKTAVWGNLASLYRQTGFLAEAEKIYLYAMQLEPNNLNLKENLAILYKNSDRPQLAKRLKREVQEQRVTNPYYHAMLAEEAMYRGEFRKSLTHYKRAISINKKEHRFHFGLARTYLNLGKFDNVQRSLRRAQKLADAIQDKKKYQSKISALSSLNASL